MANESRTSMLRNALQRQGPGGDYRPLLHIDMSNVPKDVEVQWIAESVFGQDMNDNVRSQMQMRGFTPVTCEEMPNEAPPLMPGEERVPHSLIRRGGQVLMKRPMDIAMEEKAILKGMSDDAVRSVNKDVEEAIRASGGTQTGLPDGGVSTRMDRGARRGFQE